jgi:ribosomal protein S6
LETYEALIIFPSQAAAEPLSEGKNAFEELVKKFEGKILNRTELGRRLLGYPIKKSREGYFAAFDFELSPDKIQLLTHGLRLSEAVLKFTIVRKQKVRFPTRPQAASKPQTPIHHRSSPGERARVH